ncbi:OmpA family protein [Caenispirillum bisanense]|uniref:Outer membrane protein OmpA n=1 Tax=Caenispirillum bisanense TaxID=414052 RepID=A0A286GMR5_9PROT|nr:OmpA family protein [Caenispirillum bisanense]SOD96818.1 Outer membrane protein OmpA [Caenispirillum bisanense]
MPARRITATTVALAAAVGLSACAQDGSGGMGKTGGGALLGALGGGAIGAATGDGGKDRAQRGAIGAAIGGLAGAGIGAYMDSQEEKLRQDLQGSGAEVQRVGERIVVNIPSNVTFATDSAQLTPQARNTLAQVGRTLAQNPQTTVDVIGHTDSTGEADYNVDLSLRRADAVMRELTAQGVARDRIEAIGAGEAQPIASNDTETGRAQNRRVEIAITPIRESA